MSLALGRMGGRMMSKNLGKFQTRRRGEKKSKLTPSTGVAPISVAEYALNKRKTGIRCMVGGCCTTRGRDEARRAVEQRKGEDKWKEKDKEQGGGDCRVESGWNATGGWRGCWTGAVTPIVVVRGGCSAGIRDG